MPSVAETYREWERESPATVVHVLMIDRGDAVDRLTLTDKPYYDKGVSGTKYHQTYPAPVQCIISDLATDEQSSSTSFSEIVLSDVDGNLGSLQSDTDLIGAPFTVLRGDTRWSILEQDYPNRFIEIFRGTVTGVKISKAGSRIAIQIDHVAINLERKIGGPTEPVSYGSVFNVPAVLVDSATDKYRFDTRKIDDTSTTYFNPRDGGAVLALTTDFTTVTESNNFRGQVALVGGPPSRDLTATIERSDSQLAVCVSQILAEHVFTDGPAPTGDTSSREVGRIFCFNSDASVLIDHNSLNLRSFTLGSAGVMSTIPASGSYDAQLNISSFLSSSDESDIHLRADGTKFYVLEPNGIIHQWNFSTPDDMGTASRVGQFSLDSLGAVTTGGLIDPDYAYGVWAVPDGSKIFVLLESGTLYSLDLTAGDITTATNRQLVLRVKSAGWGESDLCRSFNMSPDGTKAYFYRNNFKRIYQYTLLSPWDFDGAFYCSRSIFQYVYDGASLNCDEDNPTLRIGPSGDKYFVCPKNSSSAGQYLFTFSPLVNFDLPYATFDSNRPDGFFFNPFNFAAGMYIDNEISAGQAVADLVTGIHGEYSINRMGGLYGMVQVYPSNFPDSLSPDIPVYTITTADFIGDRDEYIKHDRTDVALRRALIRYKQNWRVQSRGELVTSITEDLRESYSTPYSLSFTSSGLPEGDELLVDSHLFDSAEVDFWVFTYEGRPQNYIHTIQLRLSAVTLLSDFGLGSIISIDSDLDDGYATFGKALVIGRKIDWSNNIQTLTILSN